MTEPANVFYPSYQIYARLVQSGGEAVVTLNWSMKYSRLKVQVAVRTMARWHDGKTDVQFYEGQQWQKLPVVVGLCR